MGIEWKGEGYTARDIAESLVKARETLACKTAARIVEERSAAQGGITLDSGMHRSDEDGKMDWGLVIPLEYENCMLERWAHWLTIKAPVHGERNWEKAHTEDDLKRFRRSAFRHFWAWWNNIESDDDNAAALFFNIQGAEHVRKKLRGKD